MTRPRPPVPAHVAALATLRIRGLDPPSADVAAAWGEWASDVDVWEGLWGDDVTEADVVQAFCAAWEAGEIQSKGVQ